MNSSVQSNRSITTPEIEKKNDEIAKRLEQLRADAAFVVRIYSTSIIFMISLSWLIIQAIKYALQREDYMNELFPNGYSKPAPVESKHQSELRKVISFFY